MGVPGAPTIAFAAQRLAWPLQTGGALSSQFGPRGLTTHEGIDLPAPIGAAVLAAEAGTVERIGTGVSGYGNVIYVRHASGILTVYAHNAQNLVRTGEYVTRGQVIARVGQSGHATGPHLHFEVRLGETPQNPLTYLEPQ
jgi:murein DD-endopeptidase MepM/ murein hydrolase activator NlpD